MTHSFFFFRLLCISASFVSMSWSLTVRGKGSPKLNRGGSFFCDIPIPIGPLFGAAEPPSLRSIRPDQRIEFSFREMKIACNPDSVQMKAPYSERHAAYNDYCDDPNDLMLVTGQVFGPRT